ncbi:MAG: carbohydrate ABC transporter substrate-binding protein [Spirochaetaceae bacterium]|nr:carbohydrate ABC transporter substrate-binding protein [Spirochaetaceae bacterium]
MRKRERASVGFVMVLLLLFLASAAVFAAGDKEPEEIILRVGTGESGDEAEWVIAVLDEFTRETGIKTQFQTLKDDSYAAVLTPALDAKSTPVDVLQTTWPAYLMDQVDNGHFLDISDVIDKEMWMPGILDPVSSGSKIYGATFTGGGKLGFWYRKSLFEANGLSEPETWDEFVALLDEIKEIPGIVAPIVSPTSEGWPLTDVTEHFLATFGGAELIAGLVDNTILWTDDQVKDIFENRLVPLLEAGYFGEPVDWPVSNDLWWDNEYAMQFMGSWVMGMVDDPDDLGIFTLPGAEAVVMGTAYWCVPSYTDYPEEAKMLVEFVTGRTGQTIHINQSIGKFATRIDVPADAYPATTQVVGNVLQGKDVFFDLDDVIGGEFKTKFYDGLKLLWVRPETWPDLLEELARVRAYE